MARRLLGNILAAALVCGSTSFGEAQAPPTDVRIAANPLLVMLERVQPQQLPLVLPKLIALAGPASGTRGGDARPTAAETTELAANPDFALAYQQNPVETLSLLRFIDREVK